MATPIAEIRRGKKKKKDRKKPQGKNIMACPISYGGHNKVLVVVVVRSKLREATRKGHCN